MAQIDREARGWKPPIVAVIGMGAGLGDLGPDALAWVRGAEILVGDRRHLDLFRDHAAEKIAFASPLAEQLRRVGERAREKRTAILASGDPLFFGIGKKLSAMLGGDRLRIVPNVTSVQVLCARLCVPWEGLDVISLHGRSDSAGTGRIVHTLHGGRPVAVLTDPVHTPRSIALELVASDLAGCMVSVGEDLGQPSERVRTLSAREAAREDFSPLNVMLIHPAAGSERGGGMQIFGFPEEAFAREAGLITKMEVRSVVLALLGLAPGLTMWDLGAGTGSISIEAARIARGMRIFAVERNESRYMQLVQNLEMFGTSGVEARCGKASDVAARLPDPDRVFVGGGGEDLEIILKTIEDRLCPGGRVVQTAVLLDTLAKVRSFWRDRGFDVSVAQVQVSRSSPMGDDLRLEALNPVFIISSRKPGGRPQVP